MSGISVCYTRAVFRSGPFAGKDVPEVAYSHHERCDGSGYPRSLRSEAIHLDGQVMAVADMYDAMTANDRPYKKTIPHEKAQQILMDEAAQGRLYPALVQLFFTAGCYLLPEGVPLPTARSGVLRAVSA